MQILKACGAIEQVGDIDTVVLRAVPEILIAILLQRSYRYSEVMAKSRRLPKRHSKAAAPPAPHDEVQEDSPVLQAEADQLSDESFDQEDVDVYALAKDEEGASPEEESSEEESDAGRLGERTSKKYLIGYSGGASV